MTLVEELREEAARLSGHSLDRGSAEAGVASNLAEAAADLIEAVVAEADFLLERLEDFERGLEDEEAAREYGGHVAPPAARLRGLISKAGAPKE